ncbi:dihydropteroate synthase, partial [Clostridium sp.]|uniref:dihydropteroate synthase n=1 Tax=Clostridium sp. TaxID=1506 RepID=UPI002A90996B
VTIEEEIARVVPVIEAIRKEMDVVISVDTYNSRTAEAAIKAGADIINDVWGFKKDENMAKVAAKYNVPCILMHNREAKPYNNLEEDFKADLIESVNLALAAGVKQENIILDPGIGFAKTLEQNLIVINNLDVIKSLELPVLLGTSRKSMIGLTLNLPVDERVEGTIATTVLGIVKGCEFIRVHDVLENKRASVMTDAILRAK